MLDATLLELALSLGFPAWAGVVWMSAVKVTGLIRDLAEKLQQQHIDAEKRLVLLEDAVRRLDKIAELQDARLRDVERTK